VVRIHTGPVVLVVAVFLASAVEAVEALTIVLAAGLTRGWRSTLEGVLSGLAVLGLLVAALGPAIVAYVPLTALRVVIGGMLLVFGLQWLRKAILRASGLKGRHDEDAIFRREVAQSASAPSGRGGRDPYAFTLAFKGVFLEGLEVVIVVLTLGATQGRLGLAAASAAAAAVVVAGVGALVHRQLAEVPENAMKMVVGVMLAAFGTFWAGEGIGVAWPGADLAIVVLAALYGLAAWVAVVALKRRARVGAGVA
jgi:uncharacterized membrane protein